LSEAKSAAKNDVYMHQSFGSPKSSALSLASPHRSFGKRPFRTYR